MRGGVESCRRRLDTGDATDRVGVLAPIEGGLRERATEELLLAREITLALENDPCELICEVFRISLPASFMRGLNIAITCCEVELRATELKIQTTVPVSIPSCPQRTTYIQDNGDVWATLGSAHPEGLPNRKEYYRFGT